MHHLNDNEGLLEEFQSAYKSHHSTETALVKVQNDILKAIDNNRSVILLLLDLSAAFDTVDHWGTTGFCAGTPTVFSLYKSTG